MKYVYIKKNKNISLPLIIGHIYNVQTIVLGYTVDTNYDKFDNLKAYKIKIQGNVKTISESELNEYFEPLSINRLKKLNKILND